MAKKQSTLDAANQRLLGAEQQSAVIAESIAAVEKKLDQLKRKIQTPAIRNETAVMVDQLAELRAAMVDAEEAVDKAREERDQLQDGLWNAEFDAARKRLADALKAYNSMARQFAAVVLDVEKHIAELKAIPENLESGRHFVVYGSLPDGISPVTLDQAAYKAFGGDFFINGPAQVRANSQQGLIAHAIAQRIMNG